MPRANTKSEFSLPVVSFDELLPLFEQNLQFLTLAVIATITNHVSHLATTISGCVGIERSLAILTNLSADLDSH